MIPKILHQTWKTKSLPPTLERYCRSWQRYNPGLELRFYDDAACEELVRSEFPELLDLYVHLPLPILRADLFRYLVVYRYGGLYADVDMECFKPFDRFFALDGAILSAEFRLSRSDQRKYDFRYPYMIANSIFAGEAGHSFFRAVIDRAVALIGSQQTISKAMVVELTGPTMLTRLFYEKDQPGVRVLNQVYWNPSIQYPEWLFSRHQKIFARHHYLSSWKDGLPDSEDGMSPGRRFQRRVTSIARALPERYSGIFGMILHRAAGAVGLAAKDDGDPSRMLQHFE